MTNASRPQKASQSSTTYTIFFFKKKNSIAHSISSYHAHLFILNVQYIHNCAIDSHF